MSDNETNVETPQMTEEELFEAARAKMEDGTDTEEQTSEISNDSADAESGEEESTETTETTEDTTDVVEESATTDTDTDDTEDADSAWQKIAQQQETQLIAAQMAAYEAQKAAAEAQAEALRNSSRDAIKDQNVDPIKAEREALKEKYNDLLEDFPELPDLVDQVAQMRLKSVEDNLVNRMAQELDPLKSYMAQSSQSNHFQKIGQAHPDWKDLLDSGKIEAWSAKLPAYMRNSVSHVLSAGNTEEVISMLDQFKQDNNMTTVKTHTRKAPATQKQTGLKSQTSTADLPESLDLDDITSRVAAALAVKTAARPEFSGTSEADPQKDTYQNLTPEQAFELAGKKLKQNTI